MSGGYWDHNQHNVENFLRDVGYDGLVILRFPKLAQVFRDLGFVLGEVTHDMDWDFSGDSSIPDDAAFESQDVETIGKVLTRTLKVRVYVVEDEGTEGGV